MTCILDSCPVPSTTILPSTSVPSPSRTVVVPSPNETLPGGANTFKPTHELARSEPNTLILSFPPLPRTFEQRRWRRDDLSRRRYGLSTSMDSPGPTPRLPPRKHSVVPQDLSTILGSEMSSPMRAKDPHIASHSSRHIP